LTGYLGQGKELKDFLGKKNFLKSKKKSKGSQLFGGGRVKNRRRQILPTSKTVEREGGQEGEKKIFIGVSK